MNLEALLSPHCKELHIPESGMVKEPAKHIALFMHTLYTGGSQMAILEAAVQMKALSVQPVVFSVHGGVRTTSFLNEGIPCAIIGQPENDGDLRDMILAHFDAVFCNSVATYYFIYFFLNTEIPVYWWIHETEQALKGFNGLFPHPQGLSKNIRFVAPSEGVRDAIKNLYKKNAALLPLTIADVREAYPAGHADDRVHFFIPGTYMPIKGYDLMLKAISLLPDAFRKKAEFVFCGFTYPEDEPYRDQVQAIGKKIDVVTMLNEMSREELYAYYAKSDCVVAPSRMDSGPMTIVEAMMFSRITIVSDAAGISRMMTDCVNGFVFPSEDATELMKRILLVISDHEKLAPVGAAGRALYEQHFSPQATAAYLTDLLDL